MPRVSKIELYSLENKTLALKAEGKTTTEIADALNDRLRRKRIDARVTQQLVSRWLKTIREERKAETAEVFQGYVRRELPADLDILTEVQTWLLDIFRDIERSITVFREKVCQELERKATWSGIEAALSVRAWFDEVVIKSEGYDLRTRRNAAHDLMKIIELKLRYCGIGNEEKEVMDPVDIEGIRGQLKEFRKAVND